MTKLGVESVFLASSQDYKTEQADITRRLNETTAHGGVKLLYITPEKLNNSQMMQSLLRRLHNKKLLSRFVIDEAHCLSDWGHDFRPDYNKLGMLRREYPGVPLMALTATANEKVVSDAIRALEMRNEYRYVSSFNRPNLRYEVRKKDGKTLNAIADYISKRPSESGVIYCLSRKDCENLAEKLQEHVRSKPQCNRVRVSFYHADLDAHERQRRHSEWSNGIISVLCATIAFGMGIDKPDVRYVIHYSMPKSITHYYQESGRAGRDGDVADCILYYTYKDKKILEHMIVKSSNDSYSQATRRKIDQLYTCVRYCEDEFRCRRTMQLEFFGETFDRSKCSKTCDNCKSQREPDRRDLTSVAQTILRLFTDLSQQKRGTGVTLVQLIELFRGSKSQSATKFLDTGQLHGYGAGSKYKKHEVDQIAHAMVFDRIITEICVQNKGGFNSDYVNLAENAVAVQNGTRKFFVDFPKPIKNTDAEKENKAAAPKSTKITKKDSTATKKKAPAAAAKANAKKTAAASNAVQKPLTYCIDESSDDDDDELDVATRPRSAGIKSQSVSILPHEATQELISRIKTLATNWAEEERMYGKNMFYWNILSNEAMKSIAAQAPMTVEDLKAIGVLGENIIKEYGERIVKIVSSYVAQEGLEEYVARRPSKRAKVVAGSSSDPTVVEVLDDFGEDEFGADIDFSAIEIPDVKL
jgi:bloom syndrome protein